VIMSLIKSISGIRGIIGGRPGENLTPVDVVKFTAAYAMFLKKNIKNSKLKVVVGRDARV
jgi:phosphomannomutase